MTIIRATLPNEFFDRTSAKMLVQPEPQYLWARLVYMADAQAQLRRAERLGITPDRSIGATGASTLTLEEQQLLLADNIRSEAIFVTDELAPGKVGHTIRMNRPVFAGGGYTADARKIAAGASISTQAVDLTQEQVSITIVKRGGPYDTVNSRVAPRAVDRFDSEHAMHSIADIIGVDLARDRMKFLDAVYSLLFDGGANTLYPGDANNEVSSDAAAFVTNGDRPFDVETVFRVAEKLASLNIPTFANGNYMGVISPRQARQLRSDPQLNKDSVFMPERNPLVQRYIKTVGNIELYESNTQTVDTSTVSGVSIHHASFFGPGAVGRAPAGECRVASSTDDNYGETNKVIWLAYEGESVLDNRFIVNVHSD